MIARRHLLGMGVTALLAGAAGCSLLSSSTQTIQVTLVNAQAEAAAILQALDVGVSTALTSGAVTGGAAVTVNSVLVDLKTAVAAFEALVAGDNYAALAQSVINGANSLLVLLPIDPGTKTAISLGLTLLSGLIGGLASITVPVAAAPTTTGNLGARMMITAPIAIPVPVIVK